MKATIQELKEMIANLKVSLAQSSVPEGNCPKYYYNIENFESCCGEISCSQCKKDFWNKYKKTIEQEVNDL